MNTSNLYFMDVLIVGSAALDTISTPFCQVQDALGGSAVYSALSASYYSRAEIVAVVGEDFPAKHLNMLKSKSIGISGLAVTAGKTFRWGGKYGYDLNSRETLFTKLNVFENFRPALDSVHKQAKFVFLGNISPELQLETLNQVTSPKFTALDTMNYWIENSNSSLQKALKSTDAFFVNDSEARELSKQHNLIKAAKAILGLMDSARQPILIIKRGEYGLLMFKGDNIFHLPGFPLEDVADPTGAGDSFAGGFIGYLAATGDIGWENLKKACVAGSVMASFCVEKAGPQRLEDLSKSEISGRFSDFRRLTSFG